MNLQCFDDVPEVLAGSSGVRTELPRGQPSPGVLHENLCLVEEGHQLRLEIEWDDDHSALC